LDSTWSSFGSANTTDDNVISSNITTQAWRIGPHALKSRANDAAVSARRLGARAAAAMCGVWLVHHVRPRHARSCILHEVTELPEELETAIRAAPDERDGYLVAADWLQQHGDPQGELVALSVADYEDAITDRILRMSLILASGFPSTTIKSAILPGATVPSSLHAARYARSLDSNRV
jgi:uncharacterized protein (TIGR02996 family)